MEALTKEPLSFVTLDVFTETPYHGNPVGIIHIPTSQVLSQGQKQLIAREFNLSEVVFLHEQTDSERQDGDVRIGIFTSYAEVPFAGHPTVGVSNYLLRYQKAGSPFKNIKTLLTKAGRIPISLSADGTGIGLNVAHNVQIHQNPFPDRPFSHYPVVSIVKGMTFILAGTASLEELAEPTANLIGTENTYKSQHALDEGWQEGIIGTYLYHDLGIDERGVRQFRTRMLASREDPATGSAASALCSWLTLSSEGDLTRRYQLTQGVEMGRKSDISIVVTLTEDRKSIHEVVLSGTAVEVMAGNLRIPQDV